MAWQSGTTASSGAYRDALTKLVGFACGRHVASVNQDAAGTGYTAGDVLSLAHASGYLSATVEVLTVSGGAVATFALRNHGSYDVRLTAVAVNAGGTGYATNDVVAVVGGTKACAAKVKVTAQGGGVVTAVAVFEHGGNYTVAPGTTGAVTDSSIGTGSGTGLTVNLTMASMIPTTGAAVTGGTGTGATFNLQLESATWSAVRDRNNYSVNSVTDEKEVYLQATAAGVATPPYCGFRSYTQAGPKYGILLAMAAGHSGGSAFGTQTGISPVTAPSATAGTYVPMLEGSASSFWFSVSSRRICGVVKAVGGVTSYVSFYTGLTNPFATEVEAAFPAFLGSSCAVANQAPDSTGANVTGIVEAYSPSGVTGPCYWYRSSDATWREVKNSEAGTASTTDVLYPMGKPNLFATSDAKQITDVTIAFYNGIAQPDRSAPSRKLLPTSMTGGDVTPPVSVVLISTPDGTGSANDKIVGALDGVWWVSGAKSNGSARAAEDTVTDGPRRLRVFVNGAQSQMYSFWGLEER